MTLPVGFCTHQGKGTVGGRCAFCGARVGSAPSDPSRPGPRAVDAPGDVSASELAEVVAAALKICVPSERVTTMCLGFAATCVCVMRRRGWTVLPPGASGAVGAALDTTRQARHEGVCSVQSRVPSALGVYCYCTLARGHDGAHVARASGGEVVATWGDPHTPIDPR